GSRSSSELVIAGEGACDSQRRRLRRRRRGGIRARRATCTEAAVDSTLSNAAGRRNHQRSGGDEVGLLIRIAWSDLNDRPGRGAGVERARTRHAWRQYEAGIDRERLLG